METKRDTSVVITEDFINIRQVFKNKSPGLYRIIPRFIFSYLRRIIHEDEVNASVYRHRNLWGMDFVNALLREYEVTTETSGLEYVSSSKRCIIASNHPLGGFDGVAFMSAIHTVKKDIVFPVNDLLMNLPNMKELFIPINKHGSNAENIRIINETFESDVTILYFPAGLVSRKKKGVIRDVAWKKTFLTKAKRTSRDVIPVHINGRNSNFFYNLANLRKRLGIKGNIEMLYLVDEVFKQKNRNIKITIGKAVPYQFFDRRHKDDVWSQFLRDYVYELGSGEQRSFEEWYNDISKNNIQ